MSGRIRQMIEACPLTQAEIARVLSVSTAIVSQWSSGVRTPSLVNLQRLVGACGWTMERFWSDDDVLENAS